MKSKLTPVTQLSSAVKELMEIKDYDYLVAPVDVFALDTLIGRIFTHSELLGLTDRQLTAYKASLRTIFWDWYNQRFDNPSGLVDLSYQCRVAQGLEPHTRGTHTYVTTAG